MEKDWTLPENLAELKRLMEQATPEDWKDEGLRVISIRGIVCLCPVPQQGGTFNAADNSRFIAAALPQLIATLEREKG